MNKEAEKNTSDDEISLIDLFAVLWKRKKMIVSITLIAAVGAVIFSVITLALPPEISPLPNVYTPEALMIINNRDTGNPLASLGNLGNMGGLAALAGINVPVTATYSDLAVFLTTTNSFLDVIVDTFDLIERYRIRRHPRAASREELKRFLRADYNDRSGVLTISFTDRDPVFARDVVNFSTDLLARRFDELGLDQNKIERENLEINLANTFADILRLEEETRRLEQTVAFATIRTPAITSEMSRITMELTAKRQVYTQLMIQHELLLVTMASEQPVFQILELAEVPDRKSGPSRGLICILVTLAAGFLSVFLAFAMNAISNIKKDPQAMAKLKGSL